MEPPSEDRISQRHLTVLAQALRREPASIPRRLEFAAALRSVGRHADAIDVYRSIAQVYAEDGHLLQAISLCKGILEIDPDHRDALEMLANLAGGRRSGRMAAVAFEDEEPRPQLDLYAEESEDPSDEFDEPSDTQRMDRPAVLADVEVQGIEQGALYGTGSEEASDVGTRVETPGGAKRQRANTPPTPVPQLVQPAPVAPRRPTAPVKAVAPAPPQAKAKPPEPSVYADEGPGLYAEEDEASISEALETPIPRETLLKDPPHFPLLSDLPRPAFLDLLARMALIRVDSGVMVVRQGEVGDACYLIARGSVRVLKNAIEVARLSAGSFFGEFAVLADQRRHASVETIEPCELLEIRRGLIDELVHNHPGVARTLRSFYRERLLQTLVATAPFFEKLRPEERNAITERFRPRRFGKGSLIVEQGSPGGGLYLILVGQVEVVHYPGDGGAEKVLGTLGEGSYFGEMSLLRGGVAGASVRAMRMTEIVQLPPRDFYEIVSQHPVLWEHLRAEAERRAMMNHQIVSGEARASESPHIYLV